MNFNNRELTIDITKPGLVNKLMEIKEIQVKWTGRYPNLCSGVWIFKVNGKYLPSETDDFGKPKDDYDYGHWLTQSMNIDIDYQTWHFENNYEDVWNSHRDGDSLMEFKESQQYQNIVELFEKNNFFITDEMYNKLFDELQNKDWRSSSCGGCI